MCHTKCREITCAVNKHEAVEKWGVMPRARVQCLFPNVRAPKRIEGEAGDGPLPTAHSLEKDLCVPAAQQQPEQVQQVGF